MQGLPKFVLESRYWRRYERPLRETTREKISMYRPLRLTSGLAGNIILFFFFFFFCIVTFQEGDRVTNWLDDDEDNVF